MRCGYPFGVDMSRSHEEIAAEYARLEYEAANAPTLTARRKAVTRLRQLATQLRLGGPAGSGMIERGSVTAVGSNYEVAWEEARQAGRAARAAEAPFSSFPQGWATLVTSDKAFAKMLVKRGEPDLSISEDSLRKKSYLGGYGFYIRSASHALAEQEAFCNAVVDVLKTRGINAWCHIAWD